MNGQNELIKDVEIYNKKMEQGQYLEVMTKLQSQFGDYKTWILPELSAISSRCCSHLGHERTADAIIFNAWRKSPHPSLAASYLSALHRRQGAVNAWEQRQPLLDMKLPAKEKSHLLCELANITCDFRDFSQAEQYISQAKDAFIDGWVLHTEAYLIFLQDKYNESFDALKKNLKSNPGYRPSLQLSAHILILQEKRQEAVKLLLPLVDSVDSVSVIEQLIYIYIDLKAFDQAELLLPRLELLFFQPTRQTKSRINAIKADLLCAQQKYLDALPLLEEKNFYHRNLSASIKKNAKTGKRRVLDVPFIRQHHMTCSPASITAVSAYWGKQFQQQDIVREICYDGTPHVDERRWIEEQGWTVVEFILTEQSVIKLIDQDIPVFLSTVEPGSAHMQVIIGYDIALGIYLLRDPYYPRLQEFLIKETEEYYRASGPRCMIMLPEDKLKDIEDIHLTDHLLFEHYYHLTQALDHNDREPAIYCYHDMLKCDKDNTLTIKALRDIAIYDRDEATILKQTETLLEHFPEDVNFQLSKVSSLNCIGSYQEVTKYLESLYQNLNVHHLIKSRYATELVKDQRNQSLVQQLLKSLLKKHYLEPIILKTYADNLWANQQYQQSYDIYRFVTCLEDKTEHYASSYFKAARFFKETDIAIEFLIDRYERYIVQSSEPVFSLFNALEALERTQEGLDFLEKAILQRPDDGDLLLFTAEQYFNIQNIERTQTLLNMAKPLVHQTRYTELTAKLFEHQQNFHQAVVEWKSILQYEPLNASANRSVVRLLYESGKPIEADNFIDTQLESYPNNYSLLRIKLDWSASNNIELSESVLRTIIEHHSDDNHAHKQLSRDFQQQFRYEEALALAKDAIDIDHDDSEAHCILAQAHEGLGNIDLAIESFRQAIHFSCDCTDAYSLLLNCAKTPQDKRKQLNYIYDELMKQVTLGEGLLEFQHIARNWYSTEKMLKFLTFAVTERSDLWQAWLALVLEYRELRQFDLALYTINKAIEKFPLLPRLTFEKADILFLMNDLPESERLLKDTLKLSPDWIKVINRLSEILDYQNKTQDAIELLRNFIKRSPMSVSPYGYLADLLWKKGDRSEAINTLLRVLELSPLYPWAWHRLGEMCQQEDQYNIVVARIKAQQKRMPDNQEIAELHAKLLTDDNEKEQIYEDFLSRHPQAVDLCISYIDYLVEHQQYDKALDLCSVQHWNNTFPLSILANKAWITHAKGSINKAISIMTEVVTMDQNYYDGWRFLVRWYDSINNSEKVLECIEHCERLYPNNADTLCFVAETLQKHANSQAERISDLLKRAYYIDPTDSYNALTYMDILLELNKFEDAQEVLATLKIHNDDSYTKGRELAFYLRQDNIDSALDVFQALISTPDIDDNLMSYAWRLIEDAKCITRARYLIFKQRRKNINSGETINDLAGKYWAHAEIKDCGVEYFEKKFKDYKGIDSFDDRVLNGYLESILDDGAELSKHILSNNYQRLQDDPINWELIICNLSLEGENKKLIHWAEKAYNRDDVNGRALYYYMLALREMGNWDKAIQINNYAMNCSRDDFYDELLVWHVFDGLISQTMVITHEQLYEHIDTEHLSEFSNYILTLIDVLMTAQDGSFIDLYHELSPKLRMCQKAFAQNYGHRTLETARKQTRLYLKQTINTSFFNSIFWNWRLSNHF